MTNIRKQPTWNGITWQSVDTIIEQQTKRLIEKHAKANYYPRSAGNRCALPKHRHGIDSNI